MAAPPTVDRSVDLPDARHQRPPHRRHAVEQQLAGDGKKGHSHELATRWVVGEALPRSTSDALFEHATLNQIPIDPRGQLEPEIDPAAWHVEGDPWFAVLSYGRERGVPLLAVDLPQPDQVRIEEAVID